MARRIQTHKQGLRQRLELIDTFLHHVQMQTDMPDMIDNTGYAVKKPGVLCLATAVVQEPDKVSGKPLIIRATAIGQNGLQIVL